MHIYQKEKINHQPSYLSEYSTVDGKRCLSSMSVKISMTNLSRIIQQLWAQKYILDLAANVWH